MRTVEFYRTGSGECPVEQFLDSLSDQHAQKMAWVLRLVERLDRVPQQYFKKLEGPDDIWEVRVQFGGTAYRLMGFFEKGSRLILTNGFTKKQQKTPQREVELAVHRRMDHMHRRKS
ncbi:MAG TPA: type II toxin-antitoxin system RelE/ParE family toxin [Bacteroidota bacterium]|nr:type II toxin-antitoxin system RelE/ParE family toxin [Bacteroidota bacterium]